MPFTNHASHGTDAELQAEPGPGRAARKAEIVAQRCPQCRFAESICEIRWFEEEDLRFLTCPQCGYAEETWRDQVKKWKGHGVYVVHNQEGLIKAGTFSEPISEEEVPQIIAEFLRYADAIIFVTRWNDAEDRLEVLMGGGEGVLQRDENDLPDSRANSIVF